MKLKYYLRGLGTGVIVATIVLAISFSARKAEISDEEITERAMELGMVMPETESGTEDMGVQSPGQGDVEPGAEDAAEPNGEASGADETADGIQPGTDQMADATLTGEVDITEANDGAGMTAPSENPGAQAGSYRLTIQSGDVCRVVCENLAANGVVSDAEALRKYLFEIGYASNMGVGEYEIPYGLTNEEVAAILKAGPLK